MVASISTKSEALVVSTEAVNGYISQSVAVQSISKLEDLCTGHIYNLFYMASLSPVGIV